MELLDIESWNRKEHFEFFLNFDDPYFGIVSEVDCTLAYEKCRVEGLSFFAYYLHKSLIAANNIIEFRYRIKSKKVRVYNEVHASVTIGRSDDTFGFSFVPHNADFSRFTNGLDAEIKRIQSRAGLCMTDESERDDVIHITSVPWAKITAVSHPKNFNGLNSIPKITFGKAFWQGSRMLMAVGVDAHHALMDGLHAARFIEAFQNCLND